MFFSIALGSSSGALLSQPRRSGARTARVVASAPLLELPLPPETDYIHPWLRERWPEAFLPELMRPESVSAATPPPSTVLVIPGA